MKLALFGINMGTLADPEAMAEAAQAAEAAGYESLWAGEHVVLPNPRTPDSPLPPRYPMLDPIVAFAHIAAATSTIRLGTGIIILPQRNPVVLAKELASLDVVSRGRLIFGVGVGYLKPEFDAIGADFASRGARTDEYIAAIKALWTMEQPAFDGKFVSFAGVDAQPRPTQQPHPPIVTGGWTRPALVRAVGSANGWYGYNMDVDAAAKHIAALKAAAETVERPAGLGKLEISITPPRAPITLSMAEAYKHLGVDRLILQSTVRDKTAILAEIGENMATLGPAITHPSPRP
ncbi:MAG: TIGR03619 family F420-dependent LLM class oxidoreductase [Alphaproteobacteria bacterium]